MTTLRFMLGVLAVAAATPIEAARYNEAPALWAGLSPGPFHVGYRRLETANGTVHSWYPTSASGQHLHLRGYLEGESKRLTTFLTGAGVSPSTIDSLFASPLYAISPAPPLVGAFPLVLIAQGNAQDVADQVVLCEYIASQGFVVAATPSPTLRTPLEREEQVGVMAETQASELAAAIAAVAAVLSVDTQHVGVVGHSFGSRPAVLLAMRDRRIRAIVSLDGGIGTATAVESFRRASSFRADALLPPLLHFYEELDPFMTPDFTFLKGLHNSTLLLVPTEGMHHVHFTTYGFAASVFSNLATITRATSTTSQSVREVAQRTAAFFGRHLR